MNKEPDEPISIVFRVQLINDRFATRTVTGSATALNAKRYGAFTFDKDGSWQDDNAILYYRHSILSITRVD